MMKQSWEHIDIWWVSLGKRFQKYLVLFFFFILPPARDSDLEAFRHNPTDGPCIILVSYC